VELRERIPQAPQDRIWDIVIVGAGAGGGTAGFNLARLGRSVLFLERGASLRSSDSRGALNDGDKNPLDSGWWPDPVRRKGDSSESPLVPIGCGIGGSTAVFSMVMDRLRPIDFEPHRFAPDDNPTALPPAWPIRYDDLEPYYQEAERLYRVRGTDDPLTSITTPVLDPPAASPDEEAIHATLRGQGLHPFRLHYAWEHLADCENACLRRVCPKACRNDAGRICVFPALEQHGASILPDCHVVKLNTQGCAVVSATCLLKGQQVTIRGRTFLLGLNALLTPALLLRSANESFPDGLGNSTGMVGRNLMFHVSDHLLVRFPDLHGPLNARMQHGVALNDFYSVDGIKLGTIQAHSFEVGLSAQLLGSGEAGGSAVFHTIVEDFPHGDNRVIPAPRSDDGVFWEYTYPEELRARSQMLVRSFSDALGKTCDVKALPPGGGLNAPHACGTCRFGPDPRTSVLDCDNRVHELDNLYVVDASFFPSSGGMNPSLTIAANALRVSDRVAHR
jgi:choline dehydrogenase-like flavoprotein